MTEMGFKVVRASGFNEEKFSSIESIFFGGGVVYMKGKKTYRRLCSGALAVFETLSQAQNFREEYTVGDANEIWRCEYKEETCDKAKRLFYTLLPFKHKTEEEFWTYAHTFPKYSSYPEGTKFARWVKLIEEVD